ncbi:MAG: glycosyltransferase family 4 protein [Pseudomonadota bacterium]
MRLVALGFRGIPDVEGGIETHAQYLYPLLAHQLEEVHVTARSRYVATDEPYEFENVTVAPLQAGSIGFLENFRHSIASLLYAKRVSADLAHIHGIGPALLLPLAKLLGLRVLVTHHGKDYEAEKWNLVQRWLLRTGEWVAARMADAIVTVSPDLRSHIENRYSRTATFIPNGVPPARLDNGDTVLRELNLQSGRFVIEVARITEHKRQLDLIEAFLARPRNDWKLVIVGNNESGDRYTEAVCAAAERSDHIVLTGFRSGAELAQLYEHAGVFCLPSSYEGMPLAVLEAMSYGIPVLISDIAAHRQFELADCHYHSLGNTRELDGRLSHLMSNAADECLRNSMQATTHRYSWQNIADQTMKVIQSDLG